MVSHDVQATWEDADPAVEVALHQVEMALVRRDDSVDGLERRYVLVTQTDEPASLVLRREEISNTPQRITLEAHVGRFGDEDREAHLIRAVRHRLKVLVGKTHAPVTEPR
jgi:hypothetical protein